MKTVVEFSEIQIETLDGLAKKKNSSRDEMIRFAIDQLIKSSNLPTSNDGFGLWGEQKNDGLDYQNSIRTDW